MLIQLYSVKEDVGTALGEVIKWVISTDEEEGKTASELARVLGLSTNEVQMVLLVNGAMELNGYLCFNEQETCDCAIKMLEAKAELDGGSSSNYTQREMPTDVYCTLRIEMKISKELFQELSEEHEFDIPDLTNTRNSNVINVWIYFLEERGIDITKFETSPDYILSEEEDHYKLVVISST